MDNPEYREKMRQAVMRFRELLDIMQQRQEHGERFYSALIETVSSETRQGLQEKAIQGLVADILLDDPRALLNATLDMRFFARDLERAFEELHDRIVGD